MSELAKKHCEVCKPGMQPLSESEVNTLKTEVPAWSCESSRRVTRGFSFANFRDAFGFVSRVSLLAESEGHHPDLEFGWGRARVSFTTHVAGGLTHNDFVMAAKVDRLVADQSG
jgi:4a-hydroxytetrahydrobiopterin dehydratase